MSIGASGGLWAGYHALWNIAVTPPLLPEYHHIARASNHLRLVVQAGVASVTYSSRHKGNPVFCFRVTITLRRWTLVLPNRARMLLQADRAPAQRREAIPREMKRAVYDRDGGKCQECGSSFDLQYDHVIPVALGGATSLDNLQLLCSACNLAKGADV